MSSDNFSSITDTYWSFLSKPTGVPHKLQQTNKYPELYTLEELAEDDPQSKWARETAEKEQETSDSVNHPKHYTSHPSGIECIQVTEHMTFNCGNAVKYLWRNGLKDGNPNVQDLHKALWYINREIERLSNGQL